MKTKLSTRFLSLMLCVLMCVSLVPAEAFAEESDAGTDETAEAADFVDAVEEPEDSEYVTVIEDEQSDTNDSAQGEIEYSAGEEIAAENEEQNYTTVNVQKIQKGIALELYLFPMEEDAEQIEPELNSEEENSYQLLPGYYCLKASCDGYADREMTICLSGEKEQLFILIDMEDTETEEDVETDTSDESDITDVTVANDQAYTALDPIELEVNGTKTIGIGSSSFLYSRKHKTAWGNTKGNVSLQVLSMQQCTVTGEYIGTDVVKCAIYSEYWRFDPRYGCLVFADSQYSVTSWDFKVIQPGYEISYDANGGSGAPATVFKQEGKTITLSSKEPSRAGYTFLGWSTSPNATTATYSAGGSFSRDADTTLYAVWKFDHYIISYNANGGSGAPGSQNKKPGASITLSSTVPTREGCTFKGWALTRSALQADYKAGATYSKDSNATLYAVWKHDPHTVTFDANGGTVSTDSAVTQDNGCLASLPVPEKTDYDFLGWYTALKNGTEVTDSYEFTEDATVYAHWKYDPPPAAPVIALQNDSDWNIVVSWKAVDNAAKYHVYRAEKNEMVFSEIAVTTSCGYTDSDILEAATYYYRVTAESPTAKVSVPSAVQYARKTFAAPTLTGTNSSSGLVMLKWELLSDCRDYEILEVVDGESYKHVINVSTSQGTGTYYYTLNINNEVYKDTVFVIKATRSDGKESGYSNEVVCSTLVTTTVYAPRYVADYHDENGDVVLEWESVANAAEYQVLRKLSGSYEVIATTADTSYTDKSGTVYTEYIYCICAVSVDGSVSDKAGYVRACAYSSAPPTEPELTLSVEETGLHITSNEVSGAKRYYLYRADRPDGEYAIVRGSSEPLDYTDTDIVKGYTYFYKACVSVTSPTDSEEDDFSNYSNLVYGGIGDLTPYAPSVMANADYSGEVVLTWDPVIGAEYYIVYENVHNMLAQQTLGSTKECTYTVTSGDDGTSYDFKVRAVSESGVMSEYSDAVTVEFSKETAVPDAPVVTVGHDANGNIVLSWEPVKNTTGYLIYATSKADGSGTFSQLSVEGHSYNTFPETAVVLGKKALYYQVRAKTADSKVYSCSELVYASGYQPTVSTSQISDEEIRLSWTSVADAVGYQIYRMSNLEAVEEVLGETEGLEFTDSVTCGMCYHYKVKAVLADGTTALLDSVDVVTTRGKQYLTAEIEPLYLGRAGVITVTGAKSDLSFRTSDSSIATVNADGVVYAVGVGEATITVTAASDARYLTSSTTVKVVVSLADTVSGGCGTGLEWALTTAGDLTISGTGAMDDYSAKEAPWYNCRNAIKTVTVEQGVTSLGEYAFYGCGVLESISLPASMKTIPSGYGTEVFSGCTSLAEISVNAANTVWLSSGNCLIEKATKTLRLGSRNSVIPDDGTVTSIAEDAFKGSIVESIVIPDTVTDIGEDAFYGCKYLTEIDIPGSVTELQDGVFCNCTGLKQATFHTGTKSIGSAFVNCTQLETVILPEGLESFESFSGCKRLSSINIPDSVTEIKEYAFKNCDSLAEIKIPEGVSSIGEYAFYGCGALETVNIPAKVTEIQEGTFQGCWNLKEILLPSGVTSIGASAFASSGLIGITIPSSVTSIGDKAFDSANLEIVSLPATVQTYGTNIFQNISTLESIEFPNGMEDIPAGICYKCAALTEIIWPAQLKTIGNQAFYDCDSLAEVNFPQTLERIGVEAFYSCAALDAVTLPKTIKSLGKNSLYTIDRVIFPGTKEEWELVDASGAVRNSAVCTGTVYTLTFESQGGTGGPVTMTRYYGEITYLPEEVPTRSKYSFRNWRVYNNPDSYSLYAPGALLNKDGDLTLYGTWAESSYKVQYLGVDGTVISTETVNYSESFKAGTGTEEYYVHGYMVSGWKVISGCDNKTYKDATLKQGQSISKLSTVDKGVVQLQAKLTTAKYTLIFNKDGSESGSAPKNSTMTYNAKFSMPKASLKRSDGWVLKGWAIEPSEPALHYSVDLPLTGTVSASAMKELADKAYENGCIQTGRKIELYPVWGPVEYTVTYKNIPTVKNFGETANAASANNQTLYNADEGIPELNEPVVPGYDFGGWYSDSKFKKPVTSIDIGTTGNKTFYAKLTAQTINVYYDLVEGTAGKSTPATTKITKDTKLVNPTRTGYSFKGWYLNGVKVTTLGKGVWYGEEINLTALWKPITYTVSYNANGGTFVKGTTTKVSAVYDEAITLPQSDVISMSGAYTLTGWNTKSDGTGRTYTYADTVMNLSAKNKAAVTLYAQWQYNVTLHSGMDGVEDQTLSLIYNHSVKANAEGFENKGYTFMGWASSEANAAKGTLKYKSGAAMKNLTPGKELWAVWKLNTFKITFNMNNKAKAKTVQQTLSSGTTLPDTLFTRDGYVLTGWNTKADGSGTAYTANEPVENIQKKTGSAFTLYAQWALVESTDSES